VRPDQATVFLQICQPKSFIGAIVGESVTLYLNNKDFWRNLHTSLKENSTVSVTKVDDQSFLSLLKMTGFTNVFYPPQRSDMTF
jgi:hypothetical protein